MNLNKLQFPHNGFYFVFISGRLFFSYVFLCIFGTVEKSERQFRNRSNAEMIDRFWSYCIFCRFLMWPENMAFIVRVAIVCSECFLFPCVHFSFSLTRTRWTHVSAWNIIQITFVYLTCEILSTWNLFPSAISILYHQNIHFDRHVKISTIRLEPKYMWNWKRSLFVYLVDLYVCLWFSNNFYTCSIPRNSTKNVLNYKVNMSYTIK